MHNNSLVYLEIFCAFEIYVERNDDPKCPVHSVTVHLLSKYLINSDTAGHFIDTRVNSRVEVPASLD